MPNLNDLKKEIPYQWRPGPGGKQLAYIDARQVMDLLDEVVGPERWQCDYKEIAGKVYCGVGVNTGTGLPGDECWVWKWDCGTESNMEKEKGEASDSFKRAAVKWGVGRFLYNLDDSTKKAPKPSKVNKPVEKEGCDVDHDSLPTLTVNKEGPNKGRKFSACPKCKNFKWKS